MRACRRLYPKAASSTTATSTLARALTRRLATWQWPTKPAASRLSSTTTAAAMEATTHQVASIRTPSMSSINSRKVFRRSSSTSTTARLSRVTTAARIRSRRGAMHSTRRPSTPSRTQTAVVEGSLARQDSTVSAWRILPCPCLAATSAKDLSMSHRRGPISPTLLARTRWSATGLPSTRMAQCEPTRRPRRRYTWPTGSSKSN